MLRDIDTLNKKDNLCQVKTSLILYFLFFNANSILCQLHIA